MLSDAFKCLKRQLRLCSNFVVLHVLFCFVSPEMWAIYAGKQF